MGTSKKVTDSIKNEQEKAIKWYDDNEYYEIFFFSPQIRDFFSSCRIKNIAELLPIIIRFQLLPSVSGRELYKLLKIQIPYMKWIRSMESIKIKNYKYEFMVGHDYEDEDEYKYYSFKIGKDYFEEKNNYNQHNEEIDHAITLNMAKIICNSYNRRKIGRLALLYLIIAEKKVNEYNGKYLEECTNCKYSKDCIDYETFLTCEYYEKHRNSEDCIAVIKDINDLINIIAEDRIFCK